MSGEAGELVVFDKNSSHWNEIKSYVRQLLRDPGVFGWALLGASGHVGSTRSCNRDAFLIAKYVQNVDLRVGLVCSREPFRVGALLMEAAERWARDNHAIMMTLESLPRPGPVAWHKRFGFEEVETKYEDDDVTPKSVEMRKLFI